KYYSASQDTLFYVRSIASHENHSWAPYWVFIKKTDTIFLANLDSLVNSGNIDTVFTDTVFSGRKVNRIDDYGPNMSATTIFVEGCGKTYYHYVQTNPITDWESRLIFYKKGSEVWGIPIPLSINQAQNIRSLVKIFPNPSRGVVNIDVPRDIGDFEIRVFNASGQLIIRMNNNSRIDLSNETCGLYYIQLISNEITDIQKLMLTK
ncbi:MAG: T9SS type A sorting domain-containing protein, partial [Bacteroidales bacterium]|nr:T9SS type A sorting domain-containing protein [Bacteroidales bacterium]